jgi:hypothetical protein
MNDSVKRWFLIVMGVLGAILCGVLIVWALTSGTTPGPGLAWWITDTNYSRAAHPSQFGFMLFMYIGGLVGFGWVAWHYYRN